MRKLLVEKRPETIKFGFVAQFVSRGLLVELGGVNLVVDLLVDLREGLRGTLGLTRRFGILVLIEIVVADFGSVHLAGFRLIVGRIAFLGGCGFLPRLVLDRLVAFFLAARLVVVGRIVLVLALVVRAVILGHVHGREHLAHDAGEFLLILDRAGQTVEHRAGLLLDPVAPEVDDLAGILRRLEAGQLLAHHERQSLFERRILARSHGRIVGTLVFVLEHRGDVVGHARHAVGADRFDTRLFDRVVDRARFRAFRRHHRVDAIVVAGLAQRHGIAKPARHRDVVAGGTLGQVGQARLMVGQPRTVTRERNVETGIARNGAHTARQRPLEGLRIGSFLTGRSLIVANCRHALVPDDIHWDERSTFSIVCPDRRTAPLSTASR